MPLIALGRAPGRVPGSLGRLQIRFQNRRSCQLRFGLTQAISHDISIYCATPAGLASNPPDRLPESPQVAATYSPLVRDVLPKPFDVEEFFAMLRRLKVPLQVP